MTKTFKRTFQFRLKLNKDQKQKVAQAVGCVRFVFNLMLARYKEAEGAKIYRTFVDMANELPGLKQEYEWLKKRLHKYYSALIMRGIIDIRK